MSVSTTPHSHGQTHKLFLDRNYGYLSNRRVQSSWGKVPDLILLGPGDVPKLPVFSFLVRHLPSGRLLHHNFVCALLNDLFGIQARGGCSCAGPYAQVGGALGGRSCCGCSPVV